jgi:hypothetical protein
MTCTFEREYGMHSIAPPTSAGRDVGTGAGRLAAKWTSGPGFPQGAGNGPIDARLGAAAANDPGARVP